MSDDERSVPQRRSDDGFRSSERAPLPLLVAAAVTALQGLVLLGYGVAEVFSLDGARAVMGVTTALFFVVFGGLLLLAAYSLTRRLGWARGPVLLTQVIALGLAWNFRGSSTLAVAIALAVGAVLVLAGLLHPRSLEALEPPAPEDD